ncbi:MAG: hypothetical protein DMF86_21855, partial [Acidobacteria bacterium]
MLLLIALVLAQTPAALSGTKHSDPVPAQLSPAVAQALAPGGVRAALVDNSLTFWWVKALALTGSGSSAVWADVAEGTLVGAVKIDRDIRDIRGKNVKAGVYTLRYGIQPANGDHLGVFAPRRQTPTPRRAGTTGRSISPSRRSAALIRRSGASIRRRRATRRLPCTPPSSVTRRSSSRFRSPAAIAPPARCGSASSSSAESRPERMDLTGRAALVTGAKRIGAEVARELARRGMDVALSYNRSRAEAEAAAADVTALGRRAQVVSANLADPDG